MTLVFRHSRETPGNRVDGKIEHEAILINPCDGYHIAYARWDDDGEFRGFYRWAAAEPYKPDFFVVWALLPDANDVLLQVIPDMRSDRQREKDTLTRWAGMCERGEEDLVVREIRFILRASESDQPTNGKPFG